MRKFSIASLVLAAVAALTFSVAANAAGPKLNGTAYIAGHGGHLAVLDLATKELSRIYITEAGGELEGKIAGLTLDAEHAGPGGGTHGQALIDNVLYVGLLNGKVMKVDLNNPDEVVDMGQVGQKFCGAVDGPDGQVYYEDMADGQVYVFDPKTGKKSDEIPVGKAVCGIGWNKDATKAYVTDMVMGKVFVLDWASNKRVINVIHDIGTFIHQARTNPDHTELWVTAANEFKDLAPYSVAGKGKSEIVIVDIEKEAIKSRIDLSDEGAFAHDVAFTPDGKYALVTCRTYGAGEDADSIILTIDTKTHEIVDEIPLCLPCHQDMGIEVTIDGGSPLLCGIAVSWK
jgi:DNA-binding beta-propeller fold protein YncE